MAGQDIVKPTNTVLVSGTPEIREYEIGANATAAKMLPGRFVIVDTVAGDVKEAGAKADGVLGLLMEAPDGLLTDAYARGDMARVIVGGECDVMVTAITNAGNLTEGSSIVTAADGKVALRAVGAQGTQGDNVGVGAEILANDGAADNSYVMHLKIVPDAAATS